MTGALVTRVALAGLTLPSQIPIAPMSGGPRRTATLFGDARTGERQAVAQAGTLPGHAGGDVAQPS